MATTTATTPFHACGLAWDNDATLAVATYEMRAGSRQGCAVFYRVDPAEESLELMSTSADVGGAYDLVWTDDDHVACATGDGRIVLVDRSGATCWETPRCDTVYTGIEFDTLTDTFLVSEQSGSVSVVSPENGVEKTWNAHNYMENVPAEVWCATRRDSRVLTGADDCCFKLWDVRMTDKAVFQCRGGHDAGVTAVSFVSSYYLTGSYDHTAKLWDARKIDPRSPQPVSELEFKGGVWKFNWIDDSSAVVPNLDAGVALIRVVFAHPTTASSSILACQGTVSGLQEGGLTYGAARSRRHPSLCAACTFEENRVSIFKMSRLETEDIS